MLSPSDYREIWRNFKFRNALRNVWEQKDFARYDAPAALSAIMNTHSATLIIGFVFSPASAGMYALVQRVLVTPLGIVSNVLATSLISHGREIKSGDQSAFQKSTAGALLVMSPILTVAALLMHYLFGVVFGKNWMIAGVVAAWVVLFVGQKFVFDSLFSLLLTQGKQKRGLALQASLLIARHSVLLVCSLFMNFQDSIAVFSLVSAIAYSYWGRTILRSSEIESFVGISLRWLDLLAPYAVVWVAINFNATMIEVVAAALIYFSWSGSRAYPVVASLSKMRPWKR
ncbi:lipopolysaccharide biosynthesis protein [Cupriavidus basilensis]